MTKWEETKASWGKLRQIYSGLDGADRILFWVHFLVAPALMGWAFCYTFGLPGLVFMIGALLWIASDHG